MSSNTRIKRSIDRLSALPDSLLIHILNFLSVDINIKAAARTSVLSKRWRYLWCEVTSLQFFQFGAYDVVETSKFVAMVNRALLYRTAKSLEEFCVRISYNQAWASHVDIWVEFVLKLKCKIAYLAILDDDSTRYLLPESFYSNSVLTELGLEYCTVAPRRRVDWKSLTKLRMEFVELHQHVVENILLGCPALCSLALYQCWGFNSLKIDSPHLRNLIVIAEEEDASIEMLEISAPYVSILEIMIYPGGRKVRLKNISAVVEVKVDIDGELRFVERISADAINAVKELFEEIQHVKQLHMQSIFFQFVSRMMADGQQLQLQSQRLSLKIDNLLEDHINSGVLSLLESCPNLETLQLHEVTKKEPPPCPPLPPSTPLLMSDDLNCNLVHLKMVGVKISVTIDEISVESSPMLVLVRILLNRAVALEKMEIQFEILDRDVETKDRERFDELVQELLAWPKSSQALLITSGIRTGTTGYKDLY